MEGPERGPFREDYDLCQQESGRELISSRGKVKSHNPGSANVISQRAVTRWWPRTGPWNTCQQHNYRTSETRGKHMTRHKPLWQSSHLQLVAEMCFWRQTKWLLRLHQNKSLMSTENSSCRMCHGVDNVAVWGDAIVRMRQFSSCLSWNINENAPVVGLNVTLLGTKVLAWCR